jgi:hypothetical protein
MCQQKLFLYWTAQRITLYLLGDDFGDRIQKIIFLARQLPLPTQCALAFSFMMFQDHTQRRTIDGKIHLV